jgi:hypothetical protein
MIRSARQKRRSRREALAFFFLDGHRGHRVVSGGSQQNPGACDGGLVLLRNPRGRAPTGGMAVAFVRQDLYLSDSTARPRREIWYEPPMQPSRPGDQATLTRTGCAPPRARYGNAAMDVRAPGHRRISCSKGTALEQRPSDYAASRSVGTTRSSAASAVSRDGRNNA